MWQNLNESIDNLGLQDMFQKFGNILSCKVAMSEDGKSRGYGFVQFEAEESANDAIEKLNGSTVGDKQMYVRQFLVTYYVEICDYPYVHKCVCVCMCMCICVNIYLIVLFLFVLAHSLVLWIFTIS